MISFKEYVAEDYAHFTRAISAIPKEKRALARKHYRDARNKGFTHAAAMTNMYQMHKESLDESAAFERGQYVVHFHDNDEDRSGHYTVLHKGKEISKHPFKDITKDAGTAYEAAKKRAITSHAADVSADNKQREHDYQHKKPLTDLEKKWVEMHKKLKNAIKTKEYMSDDELKKYTSYGEVVRKSLRDGTHEAVKDNLKEETAEAAMKKHNAWLKKIRAMHDKGVDHSALRKKAVLAEKNAEAVMKTIRKNLDSKKMKVNDFTHKTLLRSYNAHNRSAMTYHRDADKLEHYKSD